MKLVIFLGNIGPEYEKTRHNAGFLFGNYLQEKWKFSEWQKNSKFFGETSEGSYQNEKIFFLKPHTYMNLSGKAAAALLNFYKIDPEDVLVCYDDKDLPFGKIRFREKGSSGGHKGIADILRILSTPEIKRLKIGVDSDLRKNTSDFVLGNFTNEELERLPDIFLDAEKTLLEFLSGASS